MKKELLWAAYWQARKALWVPIFVAMPSWATLWATVAVITNC